MVTPLQVVLGSLALAFAAWATFQLASSREWSLVVACGLYTVAGLGHVAALVRRGRNEAADAVASWVFAGVVAFTVVANRIVELGDCGQ